MASGERVSLAVGGPDLLDGVEFRTQVHPASRFGDSRFRVRQIALTMVIRTDRSAHAANFWADIGSDVQT